MKPMLAHTLKEGMTLPTPFYVQPKLNGIRALYQAGQFWSRDEVMWHDIVVSHITIELSQVIPDSWILDGEFYYHTWSLQQINSAIAVKRLSPTPQTKFISYNVFDTVSTSPFHDRYIEVVKRVRDLKNTFAVPTHVCMEMSDGDTLFVRYRRLGYEGIMYRTENGYAPNKRVKHLLKRKGWCDDEFEIVDVEEGLGKCAQSLGALVCTCGVGIFKVGTGFDDATRKMFWLDPPIGKLATVQYLCLSDNGIPLNPSFQGLRE